MFLFNFEIFFNTTISVGDPNLPLANYLLTHFGFNNQIFTIYAFNKN